MVYIIIISKHHGWRHHDFCFLLSDIKSLLRVSQSGGLAQENLSDYKLAYSLKVLRPQNVAGHKLNRASRGGGHR
ncbi:hypothetical protein IPO96_00230 [Candidatus Saccharibacteria bacterium]|nr:MAG: hypothetical protein IPO96_00230 [Candidatus Saccharibacteria bacterium]